MKKYLIIGARTLRSFLVLSIPLLFFATTAHSQCNNNTVLTLTGPGTDTWTAPATGGPFSIRITATGAGGGNVTDFNGLGGSGATMAGTFTVQNGQTILAIAGGPGGDAPDVGGGGGGGSGAINSSTSTVLIIAAGGNGDNGPGDPGLGGSALTNGSGSGGSAGGGDGGGGGGGLNSPGGNVGGFGGGSGGAQVNLLGLAVGGQGSNSGGGDGGDGVGGGGGGGNAGSGGGAGHTGASGDNIESAKSFNSGTTPSNTNGTTGGGGNLGTVTIVCLQSLPVQLVNFQAIIQPSGIVELRWSTASEKGNHGYYVEHSADNRHWSSLGFVPGHGTTESNHDYGFSDENPLPGVNYYRLKQVDTDGRFDYSPIVVADVRTTGSQFDIFPNPSVTGELSVRAVSKQEGDATLEVFSWAGYKVYKETLRVFKGTTVSPLNMSTFPKGTYTTRLEMPDGTVQFKKLLLFTGE